MFLKKEYIPAFILACLMLFSCQPAFAGTPQGEYYEDTLYSPIYEGLLEAEERRGYDYKLWERAGKYEQKVYEVGFRLLNANKFPRRVSFITKRSYTKRNAYARYYDGKIEITTGYLYYMDNDDELAAILAHEMGHFHQFSTGNWLWKRIKMHFAPKYYERDADLKGIDYMVRAGYNPLAMIAILNKMCHEKSAFTRFILFLTELDRFFLLPIDTHPSGSKRLENIYNHIKIHYPRFLTRDESNTYYINFLLNSEKNEEVKNIKKRYDLTVPHGYEDL